MVWVLNSTVIKHFEQGGGGIVDFVMKHYANYGEEEGSQVILLCNAGKKFHMTDLSAVVAFCS